MSAFFPFIWNQWYACSIDFSRFWKATCFSELLLWIVYKDLTVDSLSVGLSRGRRVEDNNEAVSTLRLQLFVADLKLVHFVVVFTLKRVASLCVVYFTHGFLQKEGRR